MSGPWTSIATKYVGISRSRIQWFPCLLYSGIPGEGTKNTGFLMPVWLAEIFRKSQEPVSNSLGASDSRDVNSCKSPDLSIFWGTGCLSGISLSLGFPVFAVATGPDRACVIGEPSVSEYGLLLCHNSLGASWTNRAPWENSWSSSSGQTYTKEEVHKTKDISAIKAFFTECFRVLVLRHRPKWWPVLCVNPFGRHAGKGRRRASREPIIRVITCSATRSRKLHMIGYCCVTGITPITRET